MGQIKVYLAAPLGEAKLVHRLAKSLPKEFKVVSRWHANVITSGATRDPDGIEAKIDCLMGNCHDIDRATHVVVIAHKGYPRSTWAEGGYALAKGKRVQWLLTKQTATDLLFAYHELSWPTAMASGFLDADQLFDELQSRVITWLDIQANFGNFKQEEKEEEYDNDITDN